jgi:hypothetical protein
MWFIISNNFEVKLETLILLDKIQKSRFTESEFSEFIVYIEGEMVKEMNAQGKGSPSKNSSSLYDSVTIEDKEDYDIFGKKSPKSKDRNKNLEESYQSLNFEKMDTLNRLPTLYQEEGVNPDLDQSQFSQLDFPEKKKWILTKIMQLNISTETQTQLVDRFDAVMQIEEQLRNENQEQLRVLENRLGQMQKDNSLTLQEEKLILKQLEEKEKQLLSVEYDFGQVKERLGKSEREKKRLEEKFISEILGLQTQVDQKLLQVQTLDEKNKKLMESKLQFEKMIEEYKEYSEECRRETKDIKKSKDEEIKKLKEELVWVKENHREQRHAFLAKVDGEKIALEETIRELMYKNKVSLIRICKRILIV